ncbi:MAG TPA: hypothetical protein VFU19_21300 [Iamia sp.]|nr:hypothetical protein [Iamia sp.]
MTYKSPRIRGRRAKRELAVRRTRLAAGEPVALPCKARRTTPRGWAAWVDGRLRLPSAAGGEASFVVDDPSEVALVTRQGQAPVTFEPPHEVTVRPVRYKTEAFHGSDAEIIVVTTERRVVEIALPPAEVEDVARRLAQLTAPPERPEGQVTP